GLKPTYGRVSRYGLIAYASSFDQIGPITNSVEDAAALLEVIAGEDEYDSTMSDKEVPSFSNTVNKDDRPLKIAYFKECLENKEVNHSVKEETEKVLNNLKDIGYELNAVHFPLLDYTVPAYQVLSNAEASSNLARYDGIHYGVRSQNAEKFEETYKKSRTEGFGEEVKRRIMLGTFVLSEGYYDAYYTEAQKVRNLIKEKTEQIFSEHDLIILPTTPAPPFKIEEIIDEPVKMYLQDIFTVQANLAGIPGISLPIAHDNKGLPIGIQLLGPSFEEERLFSVGAELMSCAKDKNIQE
ncbi:MAG: amidase family protein, partial [Flavobacteriales bacterium]